MQIRATLAAAAAALVLTTGLALGADASAGAGAHESPLVRELEERRADVADATDKSGKKQRKTLDQVLKKVNKAIDKDVVAKRIAAVAAGAKKLEKRFPDDVELRGIIDGVIAGFRTDITFFRNRLELIGEAAPEGSKTRKKAEKKIAKADAALEGLDLATTSKAQFKLLKKALARTKVQEGADDQELTQVVSLLVSATSDISPDLDGDGVGDSAFGQVLAMLMGLGVNADAVLEQQVADGEIVLLLQLFNVDTYELDTRATIGIAPGTDTDGDPQDNFSGTEGFDVPLGLGQDGRPLVQADTRLENGEFETCIDSGIVFNLFGVTVTSPIAAVRGTATSTSLTGTLGFAIPLATVDQLVAALEPPMALPAGFVQSLADIDTDGDDVPDALSAGLAFDSVGATIN